MNNLRNIPKVDEFLEDPRVLEFRKLMTARKITGVLREAIGEVRTGMMESGESADRETLYADILGRAVARLRAEVCEGLRPVINATGVVIHTNLGRAPLSETAVNRAFGLATGYCNLEYSAETGCRRGRLSNIEKLLTDLTGAEAALVVNNNAAAVFLALNTMCGEGRRRNEAVLSRGEIVEIGDSFRVSGIMSASGARIVEVGTTNRTNLADYRAAITQETGLLLKVHCSNFKIFGFTGDVSAEELAKLGAETGVAVMEDMGSGVLADLTRYGLKYERRVSDAIREGVDIVTISGDKMLGGPQAGIILGRKKYLDEMRRNQMMRCLRADKLCLAVLEGTLLEYLKAAPDIPVLSAMARSMDELNGMAERLCGMLRVLPGVDCEVRGHMSQFGGGSMPTEEVESRGVYVKCQGVSPVKLEERLRRQERPIIATLQHDEIILDMRTLDAADFEYIASAFQRAVK